MRIASSLVLSSALIVLIFFLLFFFFNDTATTEIYTLSLHDALPILSRSGRAVEGFWRRRARAGVRIITRRRDRKSTRLNSSHANISYAVFCLKKKKKQKKNKISTTSHQMPQSSRTELSSSIHALRT